jgi:hemoglobin
MGEHPALYEWAGARAAFDRMIKRFRFASLMSIAADDAEMPGDPEFRSALVAYLEWGTRLALGNSQEGAPVAEHAPVPRWGWGEAPPYQAP